MEHLLYTIGYGNKTLNELVKTLKSFGVNVIYDVRSIPASRNNPAFDRVNLVPELPKLGMRYFFGGDNIGGKPINKAYYDADGVLDYSLLQKSEAFKIAIQKLCDGIVNQSLKVALLCGEYDAAECHRSRLIGTFINQHYPDIEIQHITGKGTLEIQHILIARLEAANPNPLFSSGEQPYYMFSPMKR
jgi:uncharacterized protein (DUF488 family)